MQGKRHLCWLMIRSVLMVGCGVMGRKTGTEGVREEKKVISYTTPQIFA